ncbi:hypothetical protein NL676_039044 [Syzygium grande]|nr:hypothetical protein NL676_039044 [Syzygium grande]
METDLAKPLGSGLRIRDFTQRVNFEGWRTYAFVAVEGRIGPVVDAWEAGRRNRVQSAIGFDGQTCFLKIVYYVVNSSCRWEANRCAIELVCSDGGIFCWVFLDPPLALLLIVWISVGIVTLRGVLLALLSFTSSPVLPQGSRLRKLMISRCSVDLPYLAEYMSVIAVAQYMFVQLHES